MALYLFATDKRGRSALSLSRELEIGYRAAWLMLHKIRHRIGERDFRYFLSGIVDLDDGFFGGEAKETARKKPRRGRGTAKARLVMGLSKGKDGK
ncbi:MAG: IS1595 family transposase, partial [Firmicutes bacterium]|nr:IS1595 family transposase [Bacillota bacterium]